MTQVPFVQYNLPNGRISHPTFEATDEVAALAEETIALGARFEAEILTTGEVSLTCFDLETEIDVAIEICANGPPVIQAVEKVIRDGHAAMHSALSETEPDHIADAGEMVDEDQKALDAERNALEDHEHGIGRNPLG